MHLSLTQQQKIRSGFTLIEMSIILLIIAIFMAGIIMGSDLMRSSKLLKTIVQVDEFNKAAEVFKNKYHELPGDMPNAESFWGSDTACPATVYTASAHKETCNGNGNGNVGNFFTDAGATSYESYRFWQQLANAGLLAGAYNGISGTGSANHAIPSINVPKGSLKGTGFTFMYIFLPAGNADYWPMTYGHTYIYGSKTTSSITNGKNLTPEEALMLDQKIDDGKPAFGTVVTNKSTFMPNCTTSDTASSSAYNVTNKSEACGLIFISGF